MVGGNMFGFKSKVDCSRCRHYRNLVNKTTASSCYHPTVAGDIFHQIGILTQDQAERQANLGINASKEFSMWPLAFDPSRIKSCDGFQPIYPDEVPVKYETDHDELRIFMQVAEGEFYESA
jgi:hypothetical protein